MVRIPSERPKLKGSIEEQDKRKEESAEERKKKREAMKKEMASGDVKRGKKKPPKRPEAKSAKKSEGKKGDDSFEFPPAEVTKNKPTIADSLRKGRMPNTEIIGYDVTGVKEKRRRP